MNAIVTVPPHATFIERVAKKPIVSGVRLNTVMPIKGKLEDVLKRLADTQKDVWIDLKARQLRVAGYWVPPFTQVELTHQISVNTPTMAYFNDGQEATRVLEVDKNKLLLEDGPRRVVGPGESVNIPDSSLAIYGFLTDTDKQYIEAANNVGLNNYMLSFVEDQHDIDAFKTIVGDAQVAAKIESKKGLRYVDTWKSDCRLMAARGDMYVELTYPHQITKAMENIVQKDSTAIAASRIFPSFAYQATPSCSDIGDVDNLMRMGYKTFMLGDEICMHEDPVDASLNLLDAMSQSYRLK